MSSYGKALLDFYGGEVAGEALYSVLVGAARSDIERLKWATLLQLETETNAWLRAPLLANGMSIEELAFARRELSDLSAEDSVGPLQKLLKYPVQLREREP